MRERLKESVHSKKNYALRKFLVAQRNKQGLTQRELANKLNIHYSVIGKIETGDKRLDFLEIYRISKMLNFSLQDIEKAINTS
jgi:ribosome-binding protein aMBF1 (putative translation factor)